VTAPLLAVEDLAVRFATDAGDVPAVRGVSFSINEGETVALVGESGCGKSVTALAIMRLIRDPGRIAQGRVRMRGRDLATLLETEMRRIRGGEIGMVFQEPMSSLNPVFKVGDQIGEVLLLHRGTSAEQVRQEVVQLLEMVGIPSPARRVDQYPHELSGGMKQRVMIAMALACRPALLIADEPTTALDVTIQAQILELLAALQRELGMAILLITHNLGVVAHFAERAAVMYAGRIMEEASVREIFRRPLHPYTRALLRSLPTAAGAHARLEVIAGNVPSPLHLPGGCGFSTRCPEVLERCRREDPALERVADAHLTACWLHEREGAT
jgi:oligopeptide/dipeptide ABC transporter ATP-binding protein